MKKNLFILVISLLFLVYILVPLVGSILYGNIPFLTSRYLNNYQFKNGTAISQYPATNTIPNNSYISGNIAPSIPGYNTSLQNKTSSLSSYSNNGYFYDDTARHMTFLHILRDMIILTITAFITVIFDRLFGGRFFRRLRRRL